MTSRERVLAAINHQQPDRVPIDLGSTVETGIHASALYRLREYLGLEKRPITVFDIIQMLGVVEPDLHEAVRSDVVGMFSPIDRAGLPYGGTEPFPFWDGTPIRINAGSAYDTLPDGSMVFYPRGDRSADPILKMPQGAYFFDRIEPAEAYDEDELDAKADYGEECQSVMSDEVARYYERKSKQLFEETDCAVLGALTPINLSLGGWGKGIRRFEDWFMAHLLYPDYLHEIYEMKTEQALKNLEIYKQAVGENIQIILVSGQDYGAQESELIAPAQFREFYKPYFKRVNDWIHQNTGWKTFYHCCGSVVNLLDDFVEMGVDILNPVQLSARGMDAHMLKEKYGDKLTFWGGGVNTQKTLPKGTPEEITAEVTERLEIFSPGGGFVFNTIHNIVGDVPAENIWAAFKAVHDFNARR